MTAEQPKDDTMDEEQPRGRGRSRPAGVARPGDLTLPADPVALAALRADLERRVGQRCRLLPAWRAVLIAEAAGLLDASRRYLGSLSQYGLLNARGMLIRAPYREYLGLQPRLERVMSLLGLSERGRVDRPAKPEQPRTAAEALDDDPGGSSASEE